MQQLQLQATEEEEEEERNGVEPQRDTVMENHEGDCGPTEGETVREEVGGGDVQQPAETQQETVENCVQKDAETLMLLSALQ